MEWLKRQSPGVLLGFVYGLSAAVLVDLVLVAGRKAIWSQEAAGWAQAIGTVLAVVATWWLATRDKEARLATDKARTKLFLDNLNSCIDELAQALAAVDTAIRGNALDKLFRAHAWARRAQVGLERLKTLPITAWPLPEIASSFDGLLHAAERTLNCSNSLISPLGALVRSPVQAEEFEFEYALFQAYLLDTQISIDSGFRVNDLP